MQKQVLRHYDIRGKMYQEINPSDFYTVVRGALQFFKQQGACRAIVLGRDGRVHSDEIASFVKQACYDEGVVVYDLGLCSTPLISYAQHQIDVDAGFMITASHNPPEYNGLKFFKDKRSFCGPRLQQLYAFFNQADSHQLDYEGQTIDASYLIDDYVDGMVEEFKHLQDKALSCFIDCGNGVAGPIVEKIITKMGWTGVELLYAEVDGKAPHHEADPTKYENVKVLHDHVKHSSSSFGIAFDGDADRVAVVSQQGLVQGDQLLSLFAVHYLSEEDAFVCDIKASTVVQKTGAQAVFAPTGCFNIIEYMDQHNALLGGELSGHFFFRQGHPGYDDGIYGMMKFMNMLDAKNVSCFDLVATLPSLHATGDIRIPCDDNRKHDVVDQLQQQIKSDPSWKTLQLDGIRFATQTSWGLIRAANTQPMISVCCQAETDEQLQEMKKRVYDMLQQYIEEKVLKQYLL